MSGIGLGPALVVLSLVLLAVWGGGWLLAGALLPAGREHRAERAGWALACGFAVVAGGAVVSQLLTARPGPGSTLILFAALLPIARRYRLPAWDSGTTASRGSWSPISILFAVLTLIGVGLFFLRALTEPMWGNDYFAIWGLKGKSLFLQGNLPPHLWQNPRFAFSHPEYPIGLPLLYAGTAGLIGRWDDHALALLFPCFLIATLLVLFGWLRRRDASRTVALAAVAALANFQPLYDAFFTGMADIPAAMGFLLVGSSLTDALDRRDAGAVRRLALASLLLSATKNEGLLFVGLALAMASYDAIIRRRRDVGIRGGPWAIPTALTIPVAASFLFHRLAWGNHPVKDFDFGYVFRPGFAARVVEGIAAAARLHIWPSAWTLLAIVALILLGRKTAAGDRLLLLLLIVASVYLVLPAFCVYGPTWLVTWAVGRTFVALAPVLAAAVALRVAPLFDEKATQPATLQAEPI